MLTGRDQIYSREWIWRALLRCMNCLSLEIQITKAQSEARLLFFISKKYEMEGKRMPEWIRIKISDFYYNAVGDSEYTYVSPEVYEALMNTFRKEAHAEQMRDLRNRVAESYIEGDTENMVFDTGESLEDQIIRQLDMEHLQTAMQTLSEIQKERLRLYFFEGLTTREIAALQHTNRSAIWRSIAGAVDRLRKEF